MRDNELKPQVDVIVPCYKYGHYLRSCVESVLSQAGVDVRVLILDDASPDDTPEVGATLADGDQRVTFRRHVVNAGHIATYNEGIEWISSDFYLLLSADDRLLPGALSRAAGLLQRRPDVGFVFGAALTDDDSSDAPTLIRPFAAAAGSDEVIFPGLDFIGRSGAANKVIMSTVVIRAALQKQVGGYRHELPHSGDMEMWLRLAARASVGYVDVPQAIYRIHAANMSHNYLSAMLPDIEQRQLALDLFFASSSRFLPDSEAMQRSFYADLARLTVRLASKAFNGGEASLSTELMNYARRIDPDVVRSGPWWRLKIKRRIGLRAWRALAQVRDAMPGHRNAGAETPG